MTIDLTLDELNRILAALIAMQDSDSELGHPDESQKSLDLINKITRNWPANAGK